MMFAIMYEIGPIHPRYMLYFEEGAVEDVPAVLEMHAEKMANSFQGGKENARRIGYKALNTQQNIADMLKKGRGLGGITLDVKGSEYIRFSGSNKAKAMDLMDSEGFTLEERVG